MGLGRFIAALIAVGPDDRAGDSGKGGEQHFQQIEGHAVSDAPALRGGENLRLQPVPFRQQAHALFAVAQPQTAAGVGVEFDVDVTRVARHGGKEEF